ncbi:MAG TPA: arsenical-resistance protein, partial [Clostridium sp.]|nr:arsenical-resistance protein [Clostridium sp.]
MSNENKTEIGFFQKYLTIWVAICMVVGVLIGKFLPMVPE